MEKKEAMKILKDFHDKSALFSVRTALDTVIPELKESEDDKIRKELIEHIKANKEADYVLFKKFSPDDVIVWLEKQGEPIDENRLAKGVLNGVAISIMQWLDANCAEGNMCLSNMECADIENAVRNADWQKVYGYMKKKLEKRGEQILANSAKTCRDEQKPADKVEPKFHEGDIIKPKDGGHEPWQIIQVDISDKKYRLKDGYVIHFSQEDDYELVKQKPAWSEEDEKNLQGILDEIEANKSEAPEYDIDTYNRFIDWLKSLKDRVGCEANCTTTWKSSDEQIKVCKEVYADILSAKGFDIRTVNSELNRLEEQLKKL